MKKKDYKEITKYLLTGLITTIILLLSFKFNNMVPFGKNDIALYDAYFQYKPMLYNFISSLQNLKLNSYSFLNGLGNPTIFNYLYYLSSPINLIAILFKNPDTMFFSVIFIKTILTSIFALIYFNKKTNNNNISIACAIGYTFSGWFVAYYYSIMWLDCFMIFPLLQLGIEKILNNEKAYLYIFSLSYIMISNFYLAFIVCVYILIYFLYNILISNEKIKNKTKKVCIIFWATLITCLICSFTIYSTYSSFLKMGIVVQDNSSLLNLKIKELIKSIFLLTANSNLNYTSYALPNINLNLIFIISFFYYFLNPKIKIKEKIFTFIAVSFIIFSLFSPKMNFIINCFHTPVGFSFRYSFIISFYILIIFIRNFQTFNQKIDRKIFISISILLALLVYELIIKNISTEIFIVNLVFLSCYFIIILLYDNNKYHKFLLILIITIELIVNFAGTIKNVEKPEIELYPSKNDTLNEYREKIDNDISVYSYLNANMYSNSNNIEYFSSMQYTKTFDFLYDLGCATDAKATIYSCNNTSVFDMIFNVYNKYNLPKVFSVDRKIYKSDIDTLDVIENQNNLVYNISNIENIIKSIKLTKKENNTYIYNVNEEKEYIVTVSDSIRYIRINDNIYLSDLKNIPSKYKSLKISNELYFKHLIVDNLKKGDQIEISYINESDEEPFIYYVDDDIEQKLYKYLEDNSIKYTKYEDDFIEGDIIVDENQIIFTSIPYDSSWEVTIDGERINTTSLYGTLLGIDVAPGKHHIILKYKNGFGVAITISCISLLATIIAFVFDKKRKD